MLLLLITPPHFSQTVTEKKQNTQRRKPASSIHIHTNNTLHFPYNFMIFQHSEEMETNQSCSTNPTPKKRAETWVQEETLALIHFRKETDSLFNTSKSNKHLWENISLKMREKGFDRSPAMCTDKWRNLLKEFKKGNFKDGNGSVKTGYYLEIDEILKGRNNCTSQSGFVGNVNVGFDVNVGCDGNDVDVGGLKDDEFMHFSDKGIDDVSLTFGSLQGEQVTYDGRVITVKLGDYVKQIGIDATHDAIKDAITSVFRLRTKRAFWLEDEFSVVRSIDRDMPLGNYSLHVDEGLTIKLCEYNEGGSMPVHTGSKTFYTQEDFRSFLSRRGWTCLRDCNNNYRFIDSVDDLCPGGLYRGVN